MRTRLQMSGYFFVILFLAAYINSFWNYAVAAESKKDHGKNGWMGVMIQDVNERTAKKAKLDSEEGAYVSEVMDESPADSAGIQEGDVIIEFQGKKIDDADDLAKAVRQTLPGTKANIVLIRDGEKKTLTAVIGKRKTTKHQMFGPKIPLPDVRIFSGNHVLGLHLLTLNDQLGEYFGAPENEGVLVEEVEAKSAAEKSGFKAGDIIVRVGKKRIDSAEKIERELQKYDEGDKVEFEVLRKGNRMHMSIELEEGQSFQEQYFFRKPHFRQFHMDPLDNLNFQWEPDESQFKFEHKKNDQDQPMKIL